MSFKINLAPHQAGIGFALLPGLFPISDFFGLLMTFIGAGVGLLWAQSFILSFIRLKLITLLPIGIAMRAFPFTRGAGAAIIALVCGLYIVFPLMIVLESWIVYGDLKEYAPPEWLSSIPVIGDIANLLFSTYHIMDIAMYNVLIVAIFLPLVNLTVTFAFMKDFARLMGGEIDVSSLMKLL